MKILIVNTFYYPNMQGGAEQSVKLLAEELANRGNEVAIYCADSRDGKEENSEYNKVKIYRRTTHKFNLYRFSYEKDKVGKFEKIQQKLICYYNKECVNDFKKICEEFKPEVIHTNTTYGISGAIWKKAQKMGIPTIHTVRDIGLISPVQYGHKANFMIKKIHLLFTKHATSCVTAVTAPSNYTLNTTLEKGCFKNAKIKKCIFNSVKIDYEELKKIIEEKRTRQDKKIKFMYAGRLIYFKGIEHMLKAFENIKNRDCELHICGTGNMQELVENSAKNDSRIKYHGKLNNEDLAKCYKECDVLIVPSYWPEPFGRVLIEGNLYGLPVIAGNCGGMPEIIEQTKAGEIYKPNDADELTKKMYEISNREIIKSYFDNILNNIKKYDIIDQVNRFEEIYMKIIQKLSRRKK